LTDKEKISARSIVDGATKCWNWSGVITANGYGTLSVRHSVRKYAHRLSYEAHIGPIPKGLDLDHLCRNRRCVNPAHLEPVTRRENLIRGATVTAQNALKTHCPKGHPYSGENLIIKAAGGRRCRICSRATAVMATRRYRHKQDLKA
jgi:hypothetical protein